MKKRSPSRRPTPPTAERAAPSAGGTGPAPSLLTRQRIERLPDILLGGVAAMLVATPLLPSEATEVGLEAAINALWLLLLLGWGLTLLLKQGQTFRFGWTDAALVGLIVWNLLSAAVMGPQGNGRQTLNVAWQWIIYGAIFLLLRQLARTPQQQRALAAVMIALGAALAVHGLYQYFYSGEFMRESYRRDPMKVLQDNAWPLDRATPVKKLIENRIFSKEPLATFALTNSLAGYLAPWLVVVAGLALLAAWTRRYRLLAGTVAIALLLSACLFLTKSRTALLATAATLVLLLLYGPRFGRRLDWKIPTAIAAAGVLLGLGAVLVGGLDLEVLSEAPLSVRYRLEYWRATTAMILDYPLFGCGPGNFQEYYTHYKLPQASETIKDPHNFIFEIWSSAGTPALLFALALAGGFIYDQRSAAKSEPNPQTPDADKNNPAPTDVQRTTAEGAPAEASSGGATKSEPRIDSQARWVLGLAALGVLIAIPLGWIGGYPLEPSLLPIPLLFGQPVPLALGLPTGAFVVWLLRRWIADGELPLSIPIIALLCLLINLLAAGAVTFPGVMNTAWVLLTFGLASTQSWTPVAITPRRATVAVAAVAALLVAQIFTQYRPVLNAQAYLSAGEELRKAGKLSAAERMFVAAAEADPWALDPLRSLVDVRLQTWYENRSPANWRRYQEAADQFIAANPLYYGVYESIGISDWSAAGVEPTQERRDRVVDLYRNAVKYYPNGAMLRAQYAWALYRAGHLDEAKKQAEEALRLDAAHNHVEQKLNALYLYDPSQPDVDAQGLRPETAEQSMKNLRNASGRSPK